MQRFYPGPGVVGALVPRQHVELWLVPCSCPWQAGWSGLHLARLVSRSVDRFPNAQRHPNIKGLQIRGWEGGTGQEDSLESPQKSGQGDTYSCFQQKKKWEFLGLPGLLVISELGSQ